MIFAIDLWPSWMNPYQFNVDAFVMPLYVPSESFSLLFSERIHTTDPASGWSTETPEILECLRGRIEAKAFPLFGAFGSPLALADTMLQRGYTNPHVPHAVALSLAKSGAHDRAVALLDGFLPRMSLTRDWEQRIFNECTAFRDLLVHDPDAAHRQLLAWEDYTIGQLGLQKFR